MIKKLIIKIIFRIINKYIKKMASENGIINKIWDWLSGHKTLIGTLGLLILEQDFCSNVDAGVINVLTWIFSAIGGGGLLHKISKKLNKKKS